MPVSEPASTLEAQVLRALDTVQDPELRRPITELGMLKDVHVDADGGVAVDVLLTIAGCPLRGTITADVERALAAVPGVGAVTVNLDVMTPEQRNALKDRLRGGDPVRTIPFNRPDSLTRVYAVASGKGGVGKSSVTVNLAAAMASLGLRVGIVDADVHGFSVPGLLGITRPPTRVDEMILPPVAYGIKTISIGMFVDGNQPVAWRGPMLHRALEQFLTDVYFGDLDVLFLDLPPGTGDIAISVGQLLPGSEILLVTTPQSAAADVAERAGSVATQTGQKVAGVIENMSWLALPGGERLEVFGSGGGAAVSGRLGDTLGYPVPLLGSIPLDVALREGGDGGLPVVLADAVDADGAAAHADGAEEGATAATEEGAARTADTAAAELLRIARELAHRPRGLAGRSLGVSPV